MRAGNTAIRIFLSVLLYALVLTPSVKADPALERINQWRQMLQSEDAEMRTMAIFALLDTERPEAAEAIHGALLQPEHSNISISILKAIALKRDERFVSETIGLLDCPNRDISDAAALALKELRSPEARGAMIDAITDGNFSVASRKRLAGALADMRKFGAVEPLIELLGDDQEVLRHAALESLKKLTMRNYDFNQEAWAAWWAEWRDRPRAELLEDIINIQAASLQANRARTAAIWIELMQFAETAGSPRFQELLAEGLSSDYPAVKVYAVRKLAELKPADWLDRVIPLASSVNADVRVAVAAALASAEPTPAEATLISLLSDIDPRVAARAANSLGSLRIADATDALIQLLENTMGEPAARAANALGQIADERAVPSLSRALLNDRRGRETREEAAVALGRIRARLSMEALTTALEDADNRIRWSAAESLGRLGFPESVETLGRVLTSDTGPQVREVAAVALGRIGANEGVQFLTRGIMDSERRVSEQAAAALFGILGANTEAYDTLAADLLIRGENQQVARFCRLAIERLEREAPRNNNNNMLTLRRHLVAAQINLQRWSDARVSYQGLVAIRPDSEEFNLGLIDVSILGGNHEAALQDAPAAMKRLPAAAPRLWDKAAVSVEALMAERRPEPVIAFVEGFDNETLAALPEDIRERIAQTDRRARELKESIEAELRAQAKNALINALGGEEEARLEAYDKLLESGMDAVQFLADRGLSSDDENIRKNSIELLEKITERSFGIQPEAGEEEIRDAIENWLDGWRARAQGG